MQIGRSSQGPQPRDPQNSPLDPDLTRANREGIENTTRKHAARNQEAREAARRDSFERSRPDREVGVDVGERIKNARDKAQRVESARGGKVEAKADDSVRAEAHRIDGARGEAARIEAARSEAARSEAARIENARAGKVDVKVDNVERAEAHRIESARGEAVRIDSARDQHRISEARSGGLSRESVQLSGESQRLAADGELPGPGGSRESEAERADRLEALRIANARGELNTPERIRNAAGRLLGGQ